MSPEIEIDSDGIVTEDIGSEFSGSSHWVTFGIFVASTLVYSWGLWSLLVFDVVPVSATTPLIMLGGFGPLVGALVTLRLSGLRIRTWLRSNFRYRIPLRWYVLGVGLPPLLIVTSSIVYVTVFDASYAFDELAALWMFPLGLLLTFLVGGGNEELGWRGFAQPVLQEGLSAFTASVLVGLVWFVWHVPLFFVPGSSQAGVPLVPYAVGVLGTAVVLAWLYNTTGSLLIPWLYHASINPSGAYFLAGVAGLKTFSGYGTYALLTALVAVALLVHYGPTDLAARARVRLSDLV